MTSQASRAENNDPVKLQGLWLDRAEITVKSTRCRWVARCKCKALHHLSVGFIFLIIFKDDYILSSNVLS